MPENLTQCENIKHIENRAEIWLARELMPLLEYLQWRNFESVIEKAKISCQKSGNAINSNFVDVSKIVKIGIGEKAIEDYKVTRYACYLIAMKGDSKKEVIA